MRSPKKVAGIFAVTYLILTCLYIEFSTVAVSKLANGNFERLLLFQKSKGFIFMVISSVALFFAAASTLKRFARHERELGEARDRWLEAERKAAPALIASSIAHDVANLLTVLRLNVERLKSTELPEKARGAVSKLDNGTDRLTELVKRLRGASTTLFHQAPVRFNFGRAIEETLLLMETHTCCASSKIELVFDDDCYLSGYPIVIQQLAMNLLINAGEASGDNGRIRFTVRTIANGACLVVEDNGPGIAPSLRAKVLAAFFTTKESGTGLGLTSVRACVDIHEGELEIGDSSLGGARFTVMLPNLTAERVQELRHPEVTKSLVKDTDKLFPTSTFPSRPSIPSVQN